MRERRIDVMNYRVAGANVIGATGTAATAPYYTTATQHGTKGRDLVMEPSPPTLVSGRPYRYPGAPGARGNQPYQAYYSSNGGGDESGYASAARSVSPNSSDQLPSHHNGNAGRGSSGGAPTFAEMVDSMKHLQKTEKVVRLEVQRRSIREAIRIHDEMCRELDDQLAYVADFKREWLSHMKRLEEERMSLAREEDRQRERIEQAWLTELEGAYHQSSFASVVRIAFQRGVVAAGSGAAAASSARYRV